MKLFRIMLVVIFLSMVTYTIIVGNKNGWNLFPVFFNDISAMNWSGQFNLDFSFSLVVIALWIAWRHKFSFLGISLAFLTVLGTAYISAYLLVLSLKSESINEVLLGKNI